MASTFNDSTATPHCGALGARLQHLSLLLSFVGTDNLGDRLAILVGSRHDTASCVCIDAGLSGRHIMHLAIGMPDGPRKGEFHTGLERGTGRA